MAYGLTKSLDLERDSTQYTSASDSASLSPTNNFTFEGWVNFESLPTGLEYTFCSHWDSSVNQKGFLFRLRDTTFEAEVSSNGSSSDLKGVTWSPSTATWYHVAWTFASGTGKFYVNGAQQGSDVTFTPTSMHNSSAAFNVGSIQGANATFDGKLSLWRVWDVVRTEAEIAGAMCTVFGTATTNMGAEWSLNDVYTDASGNGNTLSPANSPVFATDIPAVCSVVGPANLKSLSGNLKANIKSRSGNLLANIKSMSGNS